MAERRVLVVDDARTIRFAVRDYLQRAGFSVSIAEDCRSAGEAMRAEPPHAIILDHHLPDGVSFDVIAEAQAIDRGIRIIIVTANGSSELEEEAKRLGVDHLFQKPVALAVLRQALDQLIA